MLVLAGCASGADNDWLSLREQANGLYNDREFDDALSLYEQALRVAPADGRLRLQQDIVDCHMAMGHDVEARTLLADLVRAASASGDTYAEAEASFTLGDVLYRAGDRKAGHDHMNEAVRLMEQSESDEAPTTLAYYHVRLMRYLTGEEQYAAAIRESEKLVHTARQMADTAGARIYLRQAYSIGAYLYLTADSLYSPGVGRRMADSAYAEWKRLLPCEKLNEERDIAAYYTACGRYDEALDIYRRYEEQFVMRTQGYWSVQELVVKGGMAEVYAMQGRHDSAYSLMREVATIKDTLHTRTADANAQELEAVYQNQKKTEQIARLRLWIVALAVLLVTVVAAALAYRIRVVRRQSRKTLSAVIRGMAAPAAGSEAARFRSFDAAVDCGDLYAKPDITRDVLVELMGVDSTTFSRIIREQSGCQNLNDYLNRKRIGMAQRLMDAHPNWTIETVARDCGFQTVRTFNRVFKIITAMTPSQYLGRQVS